MLDRSDDLADPRLVLLHCPVAHQLFFRVRMLSFRQPGKFGGSYGADKAVFFGQLAVPLTLNSLALFPVILLRSGELLSVVRARLACTERFRDGQHGF